MKSHMRFLALLIATFVFFGVSCKQLKEMQNLSKCEFRLKNVEMLSVDNTDVSAVKTANDMNAVTIAKLGSSLISGKLPVTYRANIESKNPNSQKAALNKFDLHILFNNVDLVQTTINQRVEVLPGQTTNIPLTMTSDIAQIAKGENIRTILGWIFPGNDSPAVFTFKIKPSIQVGPATINYPGFITLSKDFKSQ